MDSNSSILEIKDLRASINNNEILKSLNLKKFLQLKINLSFHDLLLKKAILIVFDNIFLIICQSSFVWLILDKNFIFFSKFELTSILNLYSKQVSKGSWRDYALDNKVNTAIFSVYRHTHDKPLYQIIKKSEKGFRNKPEFYIKSEVQIIIKSSELLTILSKFEKKLSIRKYRW